MDVDALDRELAARAAEGTFSGVIRVDRAGEPVLAAAHGLASRAWGMPCTLETRFDTASITKLFTAVATLQQVAAGAFSLDTSVTGYLDLHGTAISPAVTPYHLLTHASGIADDADEEAGERLEDVYAERPSYAIRETADLLPQFVHKPPNFAPGEGVRYCNCSYVLLGLMVERATGTPYRDHVRRHVFGPAGMTRSGFFRMHVVEPDVAEGVDPIVDEAGVVTGWRRNIYAYPPVGSPDGGAHVTADDLLRFHRALVGGRLLDADGTAAMLAPKEDYRLLRDGRHRTGFGFKFDLGPDGEVRSYWKEGKNAGASGILARYPAADVTVALLSNLEEGAWEPLRLIDEQLLGA